MEPSSPEQSHTPEGALGRPWSRSDHGRPARLPRERREQREQPIIDVATRAFFAWMGVVDLLQERLWVPPDGGGK